MRNLAAVSAHIKYTLLVLCIIVNLQESLKFLNPSRNGVMRPFMTTSTTTPSPPQALINQENLPQHVAFILDGNGRWATQRNLSRSLGHIKGANTTVSIVEATYSLGVKYVTLYLFSTENWNRPLQEVEKIMLLLNDFLANFDSYLKRNKVQLKVIGQVDKLPASTQQLISRVGYQREDENEEVKVLCLALSYGGKNDIVHAVKSLLSQYSAEELTSILSEDLLRKHTFLGRIGVPDPDLVIRTSGESRVSNFLLYNIAYAELSVTETLWPDFTEKELSEIIAKFSHRNRRFGKIIAS